MIEIYGRDSCPFCVQAKNLCEAKGLDYTYKQMDVDYTKSELLEKFPGAKTVPQIMMDGEAIGGFTDLRDKLS